MSKKVRVGVIGLGQRGFAMEGNAYSGLIHVFAEIPDVELTMVCDEMPERVQAAIDFFKENKGITLEGTTDYHEVLRSPNVDAVCIVCAWEMHVPIAVDALRSGKAVGLEVGGAYSVEDCYRLVRAQEESGTFFMFLENCCYGRKELMVTNLVRQGKFGEIVHCEGSYSHDLRGEISLGEKIGHYRLRNYLSRNCDNYPTHDLGPIAKLLNINRGNRMVSLTSFSSKAAGLNQYNKEYFGEDHVLAKAKFQQGDIVTTMIRCSGGETILLQLDTTLPRPYYSRRFTVRGTKGMYTEDTDSVLVEGPLSGEIDLNEEHPRVEKNSEEYYKEYDAPIWEEYYRLGIQAGHGGMDWHVLNAFVDAVKNNRPSPIDVYDAAAWMSISALTEASLAQGGALVEIPDFTGGKWVKFPKEEPWKYSL